METHEEVEILSEVRDLCHVFYQLSVLAMDKRSGVDVVLLQDLKRIIERISHVCGVYVKPEAGDRLIPM